MVLGHCFCFLGFQVTLFAFGGGNDRQPFHVLVGVFFLQALHVAAAVMLFHVGAIFVEPLQDQPLAFVIVEFMTFTGGVDHAEGGCGFARRGIGHCQR